MSRGGFALAHQSSQGQQKGHPGGDRHPAVRVQRRRLQSVGDGSVLSAHLVWGGGPIGIATSQLGISRGNGLNNPHLRTTEYPNERPELTMDTAPNPLEVRERAM
jgi:hypothetical protein